MLDTTRMPHHFARISISQKAQAIRQAARELDHTPQGQARAAGRQRLTLSASFVLKIKSFFLVFALRGCSPAAASP